MVNYTWQQAPVSSPIKFHSSVVDSSSSHASISRHDRCVSLGRDNDKFVSLNSVISTNLLPLVRSILLLLHRPNDPKVLQWLQYLHSSSMIRVSRRSVICFFFFFNNLIFTAEEYHLKNTRIYFIFKCKIPLHLVLCKKELQRNRALSSRDKCNTVFEIVKNPGILFQI